MFPHPANDPVLCHVTSMVPGLRFLPGGWRCFGGAEPQGRPKKALEERCAELRDLLRPSSASAGGDDHAKIRAELSELASAKNCTKDAAVLAAVACKRIG